MSFPRDAYPYTNFHELNLGYFITHFREIFSQWADLYDQMTDWKDDTDEELATWKAGVEDDLTDRETALRAELEAWKTQTGQDIGGWEDATLAALTAWQTATQAVFEAIRVDAAGSASAAAASAGDAATAKTAAETAQAAAEAAAASVQASAAQIATNTADISDLNTHIDELVVPNATLDMANLPPVINRAIQANGNWSSVSTMETVAVPVPFGTVTISVIGGKSATYVAPLKSVNPGTGVLADFAEGYSGRQNAVGNNSYQVEKDCKYFYVTITSVAGASVAPDGITFSNALGDTINDVTALEALHPETFDSKIKLRKYNAILSIANRGRGVSWSAKNVSPVNYVIGTNNYTLFLNDDVYTITPSEIETAATTAGLTVNDGTITGVSYAIYFDVENGTVKATTGITAGDSPEILSNNPIIFVCHYVSIRDGLAVNYINKFRLEDAENAIEALDAKIENIEASVPSYYQEHIVSKRAKILDNMMQVGKDGETFIFITDIHWENNDKQSPALTNYLLNNLNINDFICGGDIVNQGDKDEMIEVMRDCITAFQHRNILMPCAYGNHDNNANGTEAVEHFTVAETYALMQKQAENLVTYFTPTDYANENWNFYYDRENNKTRFIVIDTGNNGTYNRFGELKNCLLDTPEDYNIVIIAHWLRSPTTVSETCNRLALLADANNAKSSSVTIGSYTYDMSSAKATVRLLLGGHAHENYEWYSTDGIPIITIDSDNGTRSYNEENPYVSGTITEQSFGAFTCDYTTGTVYEVKIGRGKNVICNSGTTNVNVNETITLTPTSVATAWSSNDSAVATVANGVVTGIAEGNAIIKAIGADTEETWCISVS